MRKVEQDVRKNAKELEQDVKEMGLAVAVLNVMEEDTSTTPMYARTLIKISIKNDDNPLLPTCLDLRYCYSINTVNNDNVFLMYTFTSMHVCN